MNKVEKELIEVLRKNLNNREVVFWGSSPTLKALLKRELGINVAKVVTTNKSLQKEEGFFSSKELIGRSKDFYVINTFLLENGVEFTAKLKNYGYEWCKDYYLFPKRIIQAVDEGLFQVDACENKYSIDNNANIYIYI